MDLEVLNTITTLATVPAVVALVTIIKNTTSINVKFLPVLAIVFGVALSLYDFFAIPGSTGTVLQAAGTGFLLGLTASGLYDTAKAVGVKNTVVVSEDPLTKPKSI